MIDIEALIKIFVPSRRKQSLFYVACNRHVWKYLPDSDRELVIKNEKNETCYFMLNCDGIRMMLFKRGTDELAKEQAWQYKLLLHMFHGDKWLGHYYNYAIMDSYCRWLRFKGQEVYQPFGYDAFGLPAENYARSIGGDPREVTYKNIEVFRKQMQKMNTLYEEKLMGK